MKPKLVTLLLAELLLISSAPVNALSAERWRVIQDRFALAQKSFDYRPKTGDTCYESMTDAAWLNPAGKNLWMEKAVQQSKHPDSPGFSSTSKAFVQSVVAESKGNLICLEEGTCIKVVAGTGDQYGRGFTNLEGKIQVLSGPEAGKICYCDGSSLQPQKLESWDAILKSEEENRAVRALFTASQLNKPVPEMLALQNVTITNIEQVSSRQESMPKTWQPTIQPFNSPAFAPLGKTLPELSAFFKTYRVPVQAGPQNENTKSFIASKLAIRVPGWGVARGLRFNLTKQSNEWVVTEIMTTQVFQLNPSFLKAQFNATTRSLDHCFGQHTVVHDQPFWNRGEFGIALFELVDEDNPGHQNKCALMLVFVNGDN